MIVKNALYSLRFTPYMVDGDVRSIVEGCKEYRIW